MRVERIEKEEQQFRELCEGVGAELIVLKQHAIASEHISDQTRYEFDININKFDCRFVLINGQKTIVIIRNLPTNNFIFYAKVSNRLSAWLKPRRHITIGLNQIKYGGSDKYINSQLIDPLIVSGLIQLAGSFNIIASEGKSVQNTIDSLNPDITITMNNVPMDASKLKPVIASIDVLLKKLL